MERTLEISTLGHLREILLNMGVPMHMRLMSDYCDIVAGLSGGCSCNRKKRADEAKRIFTIIATSLTPDQKNSIKQNHSVDRVILKLENNIINEF